MWVKLYGVAQRLAPLLSCLLLAALVGWLLAFPDARGAIESLQQFSNGDVPPGGGLSVYSLPVAAHAVLATVGLATGATLVMLIGLFLGRRESRSIRSWLLFGLLVCCWLAVLLGWRDVRWLGQWWRFSAEMAAVEELAVALRGEWPEGDGDHSELGVILAYPKNRPTTLILAGQPLTVGNLEIAAIERSRDFRFLLFQLAAPNNDTWLVRTARGELPTEFVNGFGSQYTAERARQLTGCWFMVVYAAS